MNGPGKTILFSRKDDWENDIRSVATGYIPYFHEFDEIDPDRFDLIVPTTLQAARYFNRHHARLNRVKAIVPTDESINACDDKREFARRLARNGFANVLPRGDDNLRYPYLLKKNVSEWGVGTNIIHGPEAENAYRDDLHSGDYLRQEYIFGQQEYTSHVLTASGRIAFMRTVEFTFDEPLFVKGRAFAHVSQANVDHGHLSRLFESILDSLGFEGICCFNYKLLAGVPKIFEVNPRYGASLTFFLGEAIASLQSLLRGCAASPAPRYASAIAQTRE